MPQFAWAFKMAPPAGCQGLENFHTSSDVRESTRVLGWIDTFAPLRDLLLAPVSSKPTVQGREPASKPGSTFYSILAWQSCKKSAVYLASAWLVELWGNNPSQREGLRLRAWVNNQRHPRIQSTRCHSSKLSVDWNRVNLLSAGAKRIPIVYMQATCQTRGAIEKDNEKKKKEKQNWRKDARGSR
jgi:hypothetical protein